MDRPWAGVLDIQSFSGSCRVFSSKVHHRKHPPTTKPQAVIVGEILVFLSWHFMQLAIPIAQVISKVFLHLSAVFHRSEKIPGRSPDPGILAQGI